MAVPGRLPRVVPAGDPFIVEGKVVPPGVSFIRRIQSGRLAGEEMLTV